MLFRRLIRRMRLNRMNIVVFAGVLNLLLIFALSACTATEGSIVIMEDGHGTGFTMDFNNYNTENKCELPLTEGDVLQVEVEHEGGKIVFEVSGRNGSEPYGGNGLISSMFTITVSETDDYVFRIKGKDATGMIRVRNISQTHL